jgi:capsular exopolysaccharide synthesis family protein
LPAPAGITVGAHLGTPQTAAATMTGADVWRVIRSNLWLILLMLVVSGGIGYGVNWWLAKYHPRYTAEGKLLVLGTIEDSSGGPMRESSELNINTLPLEVQRHKAMLKDPLLVSSMLSNSTDEIRTTEWFKRQPTIKDSKQSLNDYLDVIASPDSRLIVVSMTDSDPNSCKVVVQSLVDQYIKDEEERNKNREYNHTQDLEQQRIAQEGKLKLVDGDISDLQTQLNSDGVTGTMNRISEKDIELTKLLDQYQTAKLDLATASEQAKAFGIQAAQNPDDIPIVEEKLDANPTIVNLRSALSQAQMQMSVVEGGGNVMTGNYQYQAMSKNLASLEKRLREAEDKARVRYTAEIEESLNDAVERDNNVITSMDKQIKDLRDQMADLTDRMENLIEKEDERTQYSQKLNKIEDEIDDVSAYNAKHNFSGIEWAAQPELPDTPSFPKLGVTMTAAITLGLLVALGIAFLRELMDTSIRSPRDISRVGSLNLLGMVPHEDDDPQSAGARLPVVIFEAPHSMMAEQLRQVRTRLQHSSSLDTSRSILVTSPSPGDGKTTIAANLASGLALNGRRILLVDANFRRPELHRVFNVSNDQGFADVLNSLELFEHAVQETQVPNLFVLPSGHKPTNATELVESQLLVDFIERALEEFDHVIFDSGPLLFVSETVGLAPRVDGVISVVRARSNSRGVLQRMRDTLRQVKAEHLGVVLNAVRAQGGGYYGRNIRTYYEYQNNGGRAA